jgi:hypothetical protein
VLQQANQEIEMSHFAVMVIGDDVEKQLAPYHEFECTGINDEYVQDVDITDEVIGDMEGDDLNGALSFHGLESRVIASEDEVDRADAHMYGYAVVVDGQLVKAVRRTNQNARWDWYQVGGRWSGFLKLMGGGKGHLGNKGLMDSCANDGPGRADIARKCDIDFEGMRDEAASRSRELWDKAATAHQGEAWEPWSSVGQRMNYSDEARAFYRDQPAVQALHKAFDNPFHNIDDYLTPRDQFIQQARDRATVLYAVVKDGQWFAKGEMGWWGISSGDVDQSEWNSKVNELIDGLPDNTNITIVDCHI